jgi:hypothetical protein
MADDRIRRDSVDDRDADPGGQRDTNETVGRGDEDVRGIAREDDDEFEDPEDLNEEEESDE